MKMTEDSVRASEETDISKKEVENAVRRQRTDRPPRRGGVTDKMIECDGEVARQFGGDVPKEWFTTVLVASLG